ncbi:MAG TPA: hypothetical protein VN753_18825 [Terracidiphilus sp.]|nr:hypothetical protein [Terracidiphilus sp.]
MRSIVPAAFAAGTGTTTNRYEADSTGIFELEQDQAHSARDIALK